MMMLRGSETAGNIQHGKQKMKYTKLIGWNPWGVVKIRINPQGKNQDNQEERILLGGSFKFIVK